MKIGFFFSTRKNKLSSVIPKPNFMNIEHCFFYDNHFRSSNFSDFHAFFFYGFPRSQSALIYEIVDIRY